MTLREPENSCVKLSDEVDVFVRDFITVRDLENESVTDELGSCESVSEVLSVLDGVDETLLVMEPDTSLETE